MFLPGTPLLRAMPIGDTQLDVDVTLPNRPDLLSHRGMAREVSALTGVMMQLPSELDGAAPMPATASGASSANAKGVSVTVEDSGGAPRYIAVVIRGVKVGESPACGSKSAWSPSVAARSATLSTRPTMCCTDLASRCTRSISPSLQRRVRIRRAQSESERDARYARRMSRTSLNRG